MPVTPPDPSPIVIRISPVTDIALGVIGGLGALPMAWGGLLFILRIGPHAFAIGQGGTSKALFHLLVLEAAGAVQLIVAGVLASLAVGAAWRRRDPRPAIVADATALRFHPSLHPGSVSWRDVRSVRIEGGRPSMLRFALDRRFWSTAAWFTSRSVSLNRVSLGISYREGQRLAARMRRWIVKDTAPTNRPVRSVVARH